jgi:very-short-patch-repair endonuclease
MTRQEVRLWIRLRELKKQGFHFRRQVPIDRFVVDFACLKGGVAVELDGSQHGLDANARRDRARDTKLVSLGFRVIRVWNLDIEQNLSGVIETILTACNERIVPAPDAARRTLPSGEG